MYYNIGFHDDEIVELAAMVHAVPMVDGKSWPPILGLFKSVVVALTYMRRNRVQCELAETYGVSQGSSLYQVGYSASGHVDGHGVGDGG